MQINSENGFEKNGIGEKLWPNQKIYPKNGHFPIMAVMVSIDMAIKMVFMYGFFKI